MRVYRIVRAMGLPRSSRGIRYTALCLFLFVLSFFMFANQWKNRDKADSVDRSLRLTNSENSVLIMKKTYNSPRPSTSPSSTFLETTTDSVTTRPSTCPPTPDVDPFVNALEPLPGLRPVYPFSLTPWKVYDPDLFNKTSEPGVRWSVIVMVKSHSKNIWERRIARLTWGQRKYFDGVRMETIFIVGKAANAEAEMNLLKENGAYGDLLQLDREEKYIDVIYKTLAGMQYAGTHFPCDWFYTSADDDIMPNLKKMHENIEKHLINNSSINSTCTRDQKLQILCGYGAVLGAVPRRRQNDKWFVSEALYSLKAFPPYCMGAWYSMTVHHALELYELSRQYPFFWIDDIWITGILRLQYLYKNSKECPPTSPEDGLPIISYHERFVSMGESATLLLNWQKQFEEHFLHKMC